MFCTCWLIIYQYFAIAEFILGFFLKNRVKLGCRPPDLVQKRVLGAHNTAYLYGSGVKRCFVPVALSSINILPLPILFCVFSYKISIKSGYRPPDLVQKRVLGAHNTAYLYVSKVDRFVAPVDSSSINILPLPNLFWVFSYKIV